MKKSGWIVRSAFVSASLVVALVLPHSSWAQSERSSFEEIAKSMILVPTGEPSSKMLAKATDAVNLIKKMELPQASKAINEALQLDVQNTYLHFLNGFIYHLQGRYGDAQRYAMAIEGYQQALRIDPGNWIAQEFLGLAFLDIKQYNQAKGEFAGVLLMSPESTVSIYGLMVASYLTGDPLMACTMADQFSKLVPVPDVAFIRTSVSVYASCENFDKADQMRIALGKLNTERADVGRLDQRLAQWKALYHVSPQTWQVEGKNSLFGETSPDNASVNVTPKHLAMSDEVRASELPSNPAPASVGMSAIPNDGSPRMVLVDVVMIATEELINTSQGINLLSALTLQLGSATQAAFSRTFSSAAAAGAETTITRAVTIPALAYSLNIANANSATGAVLARPTLSAIEGQPSDFFSGTNLNAGVLSVTSVGATSIIPVDKRFGVKLAVTPAFLTNGKIQLKVNAERTILSPVVSTPGFAYRMDIALTTTNANVVMNFGETLILSGLSEKDTSESRSGVPIMQDVPLVQYLFSTKNTLDYQHSVLILVTPRLPASASTADLSKNQNPATQALQKKLGISTNYPSNTVSILGRLKKSEMFREFQQGDVSVERWDRMSSTGERLKQALGFLYY